jgi:truncated hemoglobin YjbI
MSHLNLNHESITTLVHEFYDAIRADPELTAFSAK